MKRAHVGRPRRLFKSSGQKCLIIFSFRFWWHDMRLHSRFDNVWGVCGEERQIWPRAMCQAVLSSATATAATQVSAWECNEMRSSGNCCCCRHLPALGLKSSARATLVTLHKCKVSILHCAGKGKRRKECVCQLWLENEIQLKVFLSFCLVGATVYLSLFSLSTTA